LIGKQLELLKEIVPRMARVGIMVDPSDSNSTEPLKFLPTAIGALGLAAQVIEARAPNDLEPSFATAVRENLQGLHIGITPLFINYRAQLAAFASNAHLPVIYGMREFSEVGGLISYGMSLPGLYRDKARLVDKILKGASPADLPIERPTKLEMVVNLNAAKALGLAISETFLIRADEVIQ
jgi:ABC-type uncharacterized transport system substrate-binding protein